jgi:hypothetical protein
MKAIRMSLINPKWKHGQATLIEAEYGWNNICIHCGLTWGSHYGPYCPTAAFKVMRDLDKNTKVI